MQKYPHLFSPIEIAGHTYKNRILVAPMIFGFLPLRDKDLAERVFKITEDKAKGGSAEVVVGEVPINYDEGAISVGEMFPGVKNDHYLKKSGDIFEAYKEYADRIHKHNAIALIEIFHGGVTSAFGKTDKHPWGPVAFTRDDGVVVEAFDAGKMKKVCDDFATCADFMKAAGFDGVLIHGGHGYLFTQFLSPANNTRTDEYGGSIENRGRFPRDILKSIREKVGSDFIVELRIDGSENVEGGQSKEDTADFCSTLDGLVDIIHITAGQHMDSYHTHTFTSHYDPHGINVENAAFVKQKTSIPVAVVGGINDPEFAENIIAEGKVDFVSLGRQIIADPEFPKKAEAGREDEIRRCIRCYRCYGSRVRRVGDRLSGFSRPQGTMFAGWRCSINPVASNEVEIEKMPEPQGSRNVLIAGGGPAGLQAAITAFDRGHQVTLIEKSSTLGGILCLTDIDVHKADLKNFKDLLVREVGRRDINVLLGTEVTPKVLADHKPDAVILAIGATPTLPDIPGLDAAIHTLDVYKSDAAIGKKVIMVGGGLSGCETAIHLADRGHEVTIVEMLDGLAHEIGGMPHDATMDQIRKRNINAKTGAKCVEIAPDSMTVENQAGETEIIEGNTMVYSLGMEAKRAETEKLKAAAGDAVIFEVGDCVRGAKVFEAISEGFMAAMKIV